MITKRANIVQMLAGATWEASATTLRTSAIALVYSVAEYAASVWIKSVHTKKIYLGRNTAMGVITDRTQNLSRSQSLLHIFHIFFLYSLHISSHFPYFSSYFPQNYILHTYIDFSDFCSLGNINGRRKGLAKSKISRWGPESGINYRMVNHPKISQR